MKFGDKNPNAGRKQFDGRYDEVIQKLEYAWALDCSDNEAAALAEISASALCAFLKKNREITERKKRLKELPTIAARAAVIKCIKKGDGALALKYLERKKRAEFGENLNLSGLSLEEIIISSNNKGDRGRKRLENSPAKIIEVESE